METMTVEQVLVETINLIGDIQVPIRYHESIGRQILNAVSNLQQCVAAIRKDREAQQNEMPKELEWEGKKVTKDDPDYEALMALVPDEGSWADDAKA